MKTIIHLLSYVAGNFIGLYMAAYYIDGFILSEDPFKILVVALLLLLGNIFIKPILKLILSPFIIITLGLFILVINGFILYLIDFLSAYITINGIEPLVYGTLIISVVTVLVALSTKLFVRELFIKQLN